MSDSAKQECIDYLLGKKDEKSNPMNYFEDNITAEVLQEVDYCSYE